MANNRKNIRSALSTLLLGNTSAGNNVFSNRITPVWNNELPVILIYSEEEDAVPRDLRVSSYQRILNLTIECKAEANASLDDDLDDLASEIEDILSSNPSISGTSLGSVLTRTELELNAEAEKPIGVLRLYLEIKYMG